MKFYDNFRHEIQQKQSKKRIPWKCLLQVKLLVFFYRNDILLQIAVCGLIASSLGEPVYWQRMNGLSILQQRLIKTKFQGVTCLISYFLRPLDKLFNHLIKFKIDLCFPTTTNSNYYEKNFKFAFPQVPCLYVLPFYYNPWGRIRTGGRASGYRDRDFS